MTAATGTGHPHGLTVGGCDPDAGPAMKALASMRASNYRRLLVTGEDGDLAGIVTQRDLTRTVLLNLQTSAA